jgi:hypothetical protein
MWNISSAWVTCACDIKSRNAMVKAAFDKKTFFHQQIRFKYKEETSKVLHLERGFYGTETWTLQKVDQKRLESFDVWSWRRMEKISWTNCVKNEEVLHRIKDKNILYAIKQRKMNWIDSI